MVRLPHRVQTSLPWVVGNSGQTGPRTPDIGRLVRQPGFIFDKLRRPVRSPQPGGVAERPWVRSSPARSFTARRCLAWVSVRRPRPAFNWHGRIVQAPPTANRRLAVDLEPSRCFTVVHPCSTNSPLLFAAILEPQGPAAPPRQIPHAGTPPYPNLCKRQQVHKMTTRSSHQHQVDG
jgi:hypothetical protein